MKYLLFALLNLAYISSYSQKIKLQEPFALETKIEAFDKVHFVVPNFSQSHFKNYDRFLSVSQHNQSNKQIDKQWANLQYDPFLVSGVNVKNLMLNVSTLKGHLGNIQVSCNYIYDETGRLVDAISSWDFGH